MLFVVGYLNPICVLQRRAVGRAEWVRGLGFRVERFRVGSGAWGLTCVSGNTLLNGR